MGQKEVDLGGTYKVDYSALKEKGVFTMDLLSEKVTIPARRTTYCYTWFDLSKLSKVHHIISVEPVLDRQVFTAFQPF